MLEIIDMSVSLGRKPVLTGISAQFAAGETVALIGPNGTGKSTLQKAIAGLIPASGELRLEGRLPSHTQRRTRIAYMPQDTGSAGALSVFEVMLLGRIGALGLRVAPEIRQEALAILERFDLGPLAYRPVSALSGGQRQLVFLAQSLFRAPQVLLLDEPTAALDLRHQLIVLEHVRSDARARGTVALVAMHDLSLAARFADRILCLHNGGIAAEGGPEDVLNVELLGRVYGAVVEVTRSASGNLTVAPLRAKMPGDEAIQADTRRCHVN